MSRKITLAHGQDGRVTHATATGFEPGDPNLQRLRDAIDKKHPVFLFSSDIEVEHIHGAANEGDADA